ncbi:MAG: hypothetical protein M3Y91_02795 [Actinomycetota bacterium]|nr:hypothetical protein [Actinomycetota bacterium]
MTGPPGSNPADRRQAARRSEVVPAMRAIGRCAEDGAYEAAFSIERPGGSAPSAEQWARALFEEAPRVLRWFLIIGWTAITCRLRPRRARSRVLGWQIERASPDTVVLAVSAWVGLTSRLVISVGAGRVTVASFVSFAGPAKPVARTVWAATIPLHERIQPYLLTAAARRHRAGDWPATSCWA